MTLYKTKGGLTAYYHMAWLLGSHLATSSFFFSSASVQLILLLFWGNILICRFFQWASLGNIKWHWWLIYSLLSAWINWCKGVLALFPYHLLYPMCYGDADSEWGRGTSSQVPLYRRHPHEVRIVFLTLQICPWGQKSYVTPQRHHKYYSSGPGIQMRSPGWVCGAWVKAWLGMPTCHVRSVWSQAPASCWHTPWEAAGEAQALAPPATHVGDQARVLGLWFLPDPVLAAVDIWTVNQRREIHSFIHSFIHVLSISLSLSHCFLPLK